MSEESTRAEMIEKFGPEVERLEKYAAALVQESKERRATKRKAVKLDLLYALKMNGKDFLWIDD
jgi:hypothetical protein